MSERTEVEVLIPLNHMPDMLERRRLIRQAFGEANKLVQPGRVLGLVWIAAAVHQQTGAPALKVRFAVEAPEAIQPRRMTFATS